MVQMQTDQEILPFTPITALPENLQPQIPAMVQNLLIQYPDYGALLDYTKVPFYLNQEVFNKFIMGILKMTSKIDLQQEMTSMIPTGVNMKQANRQMNAGQVSNPSQEQSQEQVPARTDSDVPRASGANATQPSQEQIKMGE